MRLVLPAVRVVFDATVTAPSKVWAPVVVILFILIVFPSAQVTERLSASEFAAIVISLEELSIIAPPSKVMVPPKLFAGLLRLTFFPVPGLIVVVLETESTTSSRLAGLLIMRFLYVVPQASFVESSTDVVS